MCLDHNHPDYGQNSRKHPTRWSVIGRWNKQRSFPLTPSSRAPHGFRYIRYRKHRVSRTARDRGRMARGSGPKQLAHRAFPPAVKPTKAHRPQCSGYAPHSRLRVGGLPAIYQLRTAGGRAIHRRPQCRLRLEGRRRTASKAHLRFGSQSIFVLGAGQPLTIGNALPSSSRYCAQFVEECSFSRAGRETIGSSSNSFYASSSQIPTSRGNRSGLPMSGPVLPRS